MLKNKVLYWSSGVYDIAAAYAPAAERLRTRCRINPVRLRIACVGSARDATQPRPPPFPQGARGGRTGEIVGATTSVAVRAPDSQGNEGYATATDSYVKKAWAMARLRARLARAIMFQLFVQSD